jgi:hypothetical protein
MLCLLTRPSLKKFFPVLKKHYPHAEGFSQDQEGLHDAFKNTGLIKLHDFVYGRYTDVDAIIAYPQEEWLLVGVKKGSCFR